MVGKCNQQVAGDRRRAAQTCDEGRVNDATEQRIDGDELLEVDGRELGPKIDPLSPTAHECPQRNATDG